MVAYLYNKIQPGAKRAFCSGCNQAFITLTQRDGVNIGQFLFAENQVVLRLRAFLYLS